MHSVILQIVIFNIIYSVGSERVAELDVCAECGPNSDCRIVNGVPICSCRPGYVYTPPGTCTSAPECTQDYDCPKDLACVRSKCEDSCVFCGRNAECRVVNHHAACKCPPGYKGDPLISCARECSIDSDCPNNRACIQYNCVDPCVKACGVNAECRVVNHHAACACPTGYKGDPFISCAPECSIDPDCPNNRGCVRYNCVDPCVKACGVNAVCRVVNHKASCACLPGYKGDPFISCAPECSIDSDCPNNRACVQYNCVDPCVKACGVNAVCRIVNHHAACTCLTGYHGDPLIACFPECFTDSNCANNHACVQNNCVDPCVKACGVNAKCRVSSHRATCKCRKGFKGDPLKKCKRKSDDEDDYYLDSLFDYFW